MCGGSLALSLYKRSKGQQLHREGLTCTNMYAHLPQLPKQRAEKLITTHTVSMTSFFAQDAINLPYLYTALMFKISIVEPLNLCRQTKGANIATKPNMLTNFTSSTVYK